MDDIPPIFFNAVLIIPDCIYLPNLIKTVGLPWADYCHFLSSTAIFTLHYAGKLAPASCNNGRNFL